MGFPDITAIADCMSDSLTQNLFEISSDPHVAEFWKIYEEFDIRVRRGDTVYDIYHPELEKAFHNITPEYRNQILSALQRAESVGDTGYPLRYFQEFSISDNLLAIRRLLRYSLPPLDELTQKLESQSAQRNSEKLAELILAIANRVNEGYGVDSSVFQELEIRCRCLPRGERLATRENMTQFFSNINTHRLNSNAAIINDENINSIPTSPLVTQSNITENGNNDGICRKLKKNLNSFFWYICSFFIGGENLEVDPKMDQENIFLKKEAPEEEKVDSKTLLQGCWKIMKNIGKKLWSWF